MTDKKVTEPDRAGLKAVLEAGDVRLEPLGEHHLDPLRAACAEDQDIWQVYPVNLLGDGFDEAMARFDQLDSWVRFAVIDAREGKVVGCTNYINPDPWGVVEIGGTYIAPSVRGGIFNRTKKKLMIEHAFACGYHKIEWRVDTRNKRSMAAVLKLGAKQEGVLRQNRVTWTGYRRDTAVFGMLQGEWAG
uniref:GNAT family N-acetyltransferase n=1 Tax=uncultured Altererythrobacter sp. TaxID=500840 RepID=UPI002623605F|nr:GNAT family protein [uncultured Altererythrobacter sp.]